jgi:hypothetical protein
MNLLLKIYSNKDINKKRLTYPAANGQRHSDPNTTGQEDQHNDQQKKTNFQYFHFVFSLDL